MIIEDVFIIKKRGPVACVKLDAVLGPQPGDTLRRTDGTTWRISGVEWWAMPRSPTRPGRGDSVGLLLPKDADVKAGDVVEVVPQNESSPTKP